MTPQAHLQILFEAHRRTRRYPAQSDQSEAYERPATGFGKGIARGLTAALGALAAWTAACRSAGGADGRGGGKTPLAAWPDAVAAAAAAAAGAAAAVAAAGAARVAAAAAEAHTAAAAAAEAAAAVEGMPARHMILRKSLLQ